MLKVQYLLFALLTLSFASVGLAQEKKASGETSTKLEEVHQEAEKAARSPGSDEADQVITNKKLRAETGSLSKWSISTSLRYQGGSVEKPGSAVRPNILGSKGTPALSRIMGDVGVKYRTSKLTSLTLGVGLVMTTPFQEKADTKGYNPKAGAAIQRQFARNDDKLEANDPSLAFTKLTKLGSVQSVTSVIGTSYTTQVYRDLGYAAGLTLQQIFAYDIGTSGLTLGANFQVSANAFDKGKNTFSAAAGGPAGYERADYSLGFYPFMEYTINDKFSLRTISGLYLYEHTDMDSNFWRLNKNTIYQSVGVGISVTRDIYLYPNVQFLPENIRADMTNIGLNTNINVF